jgi:hypothetical protein
MSDRLQRLQRDLDQWVRKEQRISADIEAIQGRIESAADRGDSARGLRAALDRKIAYLRDIRADTEAIRERMSAGESTKARAARCGTGV